MDSNPLAFVFFDTEKGGDRHSDGRADLQTETDRQTQADRQTETESERQRQRQREEKLGKSVQGNRKRVNIMKHNQFRPFPKNALNKIEAKEHTVTVKVQKIAL